MSELIHHVASSISVASGAHAEAARRSVAPAGVPLLERLAMRLAGAQHTPRPRSARRTIVVVAADHRAGDPGIALGASHPTVVAAHAIADGSAALAQVARACRVPILLVDAGATETAAMPAAAVKLGPGGPGLTIADATAGVEAGIALAISLADDGLDLLAIGALGLGSEVAAEALLAAVSSGRSGVEQLAAHGGPDTAVLAGLILGAASINVPVMLDSYATGAAALVAAAYAPAVVGCLVAAHVGTLAHPAILAHLGLVPLFGVGLGHGEGTGAVMAIPLADQVAALVDRSA